MDWWAVGILIYEMMFGKTPFFHKKRHVIKKLILDMPVLFSLHSASVISSEAQDLISGLLQKKPEERLGFHGGADQILAHPWFNDFDFSAL